MVSLFLTVPAGEKDQVIAELWEGGTEGVLEEDQPDGLSRLQAFFSDEAIAATLRERHHELEPRVERVPEWDWANQWRANWEPMEVGERLYLAPVWRDDPTPATRVRVPVHAGMAFGTGLHETTQLCLEALERHVRLGATMFDIGTGTGMLAVAAGLLGAGTLIGCDNDPEAVEAAYVNALDDGVPLRLFLGTSDAVRDGAADLITANINPETCAALASELRRLLRPGGVAITSGFERQEAAGVAASLRAQGLKVVEENVKGSWMSLVARR